MSTDNEVRVEKVMRDIIEARSFTVIEMLIEDAVVGTQDEKYTIFGKLQASRNLDEIWLLAHEWLACYHLEAAKRIKAFMDKKSKRQQGELL